MVTTKFPYGAINDKLVVYVMFNKTRNKYYLVDVSANAYEIEKSIFDELKKKGVEEK